MATNIDKWARRANRQITAIAEINKSLEEKPGYAENFLRDILLAILAALHCNLMLSLALYHRSNKPTKL